MINNKFTIIVNTYPRANRRKDLINCLDSIDKQVYKNFSVILVENNNNLDEVEVITKKYKNLIIKSVLCPIKRLSRLFNVGWQTAKTEYLAYLADDTKAHQDWLLNIFRELSDKKIGAVSGPVISSCFPTGEMHGLYLKMNANILGKLILLPYLYLAMDNNPLAPGKYFASGAYSFGTALPESIKFKRQEIDLLTTTSMGIRKSLLVKLNGFDERFCFNHADGDLFLRIKAMGYKLIFNPNIRVTHMVRIGPSRNAYFVGRDTGMFHKKHLRPKNLRTLLGAVLNIFVLNSYWLYSTIKNKDIKQLKGIYGYIEAIVGRRK